MVPLAASRPRLFGERCLFSDWRGRLLAELLSLQAHARLKATQGLVSASASGDWVGLLRCKSLGNFITLIYKSRSPGVVAKATA